MNITFLIYLDTSIWLSYFMRDKNYKKSEEILKNAIENNETNILFSSLILLEIIDVIRKKTPEKELFQGKNAQVISNIENKIEEKITKILDIFSKWESSEKACLINPDISVDNYHKKTFSNLQICYGNVFCDFEKGKYYYHGPGNDDVQHALIAKNCHASELQSFDQGFEKFITMQEFENLKIVVC